MNKHQENNQRILSIHSLHRIIEHILQKSDLFPTRVFSVYFPIWAVEIEARQKSRGDYWLIDKYIERSILQADLHTTSELAAFLGIERRLVEKAVNLLSAIGHVTETNGRLHLTPLGIESQKDQQRYTLLETHRLLYVDRFLAQPLLADHYDSRNMQFLSNEVLPLRHKDQIFQRLCSLKKWDNSVLAALEKNENKAQYNIPDEVTELKLLAYEECYTPVYIFETRKHTQQNVRQLYYLVYTGLQEMQDLFFEQIVNASHDIQAQLQEKEENLAHLWENYVTKRNISTKRLSQQADGSWQLCLLATDLQSPKAQKAFNAIGKYWTEKEYLLRIWCDDENIRRNAALDQTLDFIERKRQISLDELDEYLLLRANILHVQNQSRSDLLERAREKKRESVLKVLEALEA